MLFVLWTNPKSLQFCFKSLLANQLYNWLKFKKKSLLEYHLLSFTEDTNYVNSKSYSDPNLLKVAFRNILSWT